MTAESPQQAPPVAPMTPPATNFVLGAGSGGSRGPNTKVLGAVVAAAVLGGAGYFAVGALGGTDEPASVRSVPTAPAPKPTAKAAVKPALTTRPADLGFVLRNLATAQEVVLMDTGTYTKDVKALEGEFGKVFATNVRYSVVAASKTRHCLRASGAGTLVAYYDSATGKVTTAPCR